MQAASSQRSTLTRVNWLRLRNASSYSPQNLKLAPPISECGARTASGLKPQNFKTFNPCLKMCNTLKPFLPESKTVKTMESMRNTQKKRTETKRFEYTRAPPAIKALPHQARRHLLQERGTTLFGRSCRRAPDDSGC